MPTTNRNTPTTNSHSPITNGYLTLTTMSNDVRLKASKGIRQTCVSKEEKAAERGKDPIGCRSGKKEGNDYVWKHLS